MSVIREQVIDGNIYQMLSNTLGIRKLGPEQRDDWCLVNDAWSTINARAFLYLNDDELINLRDFINVTTFMPPSEYRLKKIIPQTIQQYIKNVMLLDESTVFGMHGILFRLTKEAAIGSPVWRLTYDNSMVNPVFLDADTVLCYLESIINK
jgi:hypothetical protein